jgi:hypothetical protein
VSFDKYMPIPHPWHSYVAVPFNFGNDPGLQEQDELPVVVVDVKKGHALHSVNNLSGNTTLVPV